MARAPRGRTILVIALIGAIVAAYALWPRAGTRNNRIEGSGTIEATQVDVTSKVGGRVVSISVREGDAVQAGQTVADLDAAEIDAQAAQAQAAVDAARTRVMQAEQSLQLQIVSVDTQVTQARAQVQSAAAALQAVDAGTRAAEASLASAEAGLARAESDWKRLESLHRDGAISAQQLDAARTAVMAATSQRDAARAQRDAARAQRDAARAQRESAQAVVHAAEANRRTIDIRRQDVEASRAQVRQAQAALRLAEITRGQAILRAPIAGTVVARNVEVGDLVTPGAPVLTIADLSRPYLRVFVSETDLGRVAIGQPVEITVDAFPGRRFHGTVSEISSRAEFTPGNVQTKEERVKLVFAVKVSVENQQGVLKPGLPADAVIQTGPGGR